MSNDPPPPRGPLAHWNAIPLYLRIVIAMLLGIVAGLALGERAEIMEGPSQVILQLLGALAPPLILVAVTHVLMTTDIQGKQALRLCGLLLLNTCVAIAIGLTIANVLRPGEWFEKPEKATAETPAAAAVVVAQQPAVENREADPAHEGGDPIGLLVENVPRSLLGPLGDKQNIIGVIIIAVAFGVAMRGVKSRPLATVQDFVEVAYETLLVVLHWIIQLVPIGVFAIVAKVVGVEGFKPFLGMGVFVLAVLLALALQTTWYLTRIQLGSWARPLDVLRGVRDALVMAFSTGSSTATMPVTYAALKDQVGLREESASMGALVGANFNNDGTALYEAMAALFIAQTLGQDLTLTQQLIVVFTSIIASVGAAGIPEAGIVTMTLVFRAVDLPIESIPLLLTVDWFLDRCRTAINVLGDVNVACLLDGRSKPDPTDADDELAVASS
ncbi:MAG: dicarboxylate/amino acid:cation symporter [Planctomycetota bacterium]